MKTSQVQRRIVFLAGSLLFAVVILCAYILEDRCKLPDGYTPIEDVVELLIIAAVLLNMKKAGILGCSTFVAKEDLLYLATPMVLIMVSQLVWVTGNAGLWKNLFLITGTLTTGFSEELYFRVAGFCFLSRKGMRHLNWGDAITLILGFALAHVPGIILRGWEASAFQVGLACSLGILLLGTYLNTRSWVLIGIAHALFNYLSSVTALNSTIRKGILPIGVCYACLALGLLLAITIGFVLLKGHIKTKLE